MNRKKEFTVSEISKVKVNIESELITKGQFCSIDKLNPTTLKSTGFYCIRLKASSSLPNRYQKILDKREHKLLYIGKAEGQTLEGRLSQELVQKGAGTFFRSIGCVLQIPPIEGHLKGKSNQNNYKFSQENKQKIIQWLRENIELSIVAYDGDFGIEGELIGMYCPLLNIQHNPVSLRELEDDRDKWRKIASG